MSESNTEINYKEAYEREHEKCADLADKIVVLESEKEDLQFKLDRIKKNKFWKATGPARSVIHFAQRQKERLSHCGGPKDILRKIRNKSHQKSLMESYGTGSFPDAEQRKKEEETVFPYMPKISILVPLWNNKREFQIQMLDCVMNQTYQNWELCLADGSDAEHAYIAELQQMLENTDGVGKVKVLVKTTDTKEVTGVLVVCEGGDDKNLVAYITDAINGLLGVPVHKIKVMKMSE